MAMFGTSGIRDLSPKIVSPKLSMQVGALLAKYGKKIAIGFDGRRSGHMLKAALASGALGAGADVYDLGLCATPTLAYYCKKIGAYGAMITASHNPPEYNGIKLFEFGSEMPKEKEDEIERAIHSGAKQEPVLWEKAGRMLDVDEESDEEHLKLILSQIDVAKIKAKKPLIVVDLANAGACSLMPQLLAKAGCKVISINSTPGEPYGRELEPSANSLVKLRKAVKAKKAALGIAHDGDADRAVIVDEKGELLGLDAQLGLIVKDILESNVKRGGSGAKIVSTVESSFSLKEICAEHGASLEITPVGSLKVAARMKEVGAIFGGEPCGEYVFVGGSPVPDGLMTGLYFVQMFCEKGKLSAQAAGIARYPSSREKIPCSNERKKDALAKIAKAWPFETKSTIDGLMHLDEDGKALVRPSGTEPYMRITIEATSEPELRVMAAKITPIVKKACEG